MFVIIPNKKLCCAYRCSNLKSKKDRFCPKHRKRYDKEFNTVSYVFNILRSNAKRRGKSFELTLQEFTQFCEETDYINKRGKTGKSASIDRIDSSKGYHINNIRILSLSENSRKGNKDPDEDLPF